MEPYPSDEVFEMFVRMHGDEGWLLARLIEPSDWIDTENYVPYGEGMVFESVSSEPDPKALLLAVENAWADGLLDLSDDGQSLVYVGEAVS
jgi:hypothetical protein